MERDGDTNRINQRKNWDHLNKSILKIGLNTEKDPGDQRRLAVARILVKDHQLLQVWKTPKKWNNNNKAMEYESDSDTKYCWSTMKSPQESGKEA